MARDSLILLASFGYLGILFAVAYWADKRSDAGRSVISNPYVYTLSIAVYCTAWTFYGSVGRASTGGASFLPIYLGPTLMAVLFWVVLRKMVRISKQHRITSIADFVASRYGKSTLLGGLVTVIAVIGILPYIALQLKAVSLSFLVLHAYPDLGSIPVPSEVPLWRDTALMVALLLGAFAVLFGTRHIDATERHEGMVAAIAVESIVKLVGFLAVGAFVTWGMFGGAGDVFARAMDDPKLAQMLSLPVGGGQYTEWFALTLLALLALLFLPRQFQVAVVENVNEDHVRKAAWLFPAYLLLINLFVLPLAVAGAVMFGGSGVDSDTYVLTLPLSADAWWIALFAFIGGLSAATGMVIVETIALSTMVCNDFLMPILLRLRGQWVSARPDLTKLLLYVRRGAILGVLFLGYLYYRLIGESYALVSIGLVSFVAAAQFAPAILVGMYWKGASRAGALAGLCGGFAAWLYTLLLPSFARSGWIDLAFVRQGPFGLEWLKPYALFGLTGLDPIAHALFWTMLFNLGGLVFISLVTRQSAVEQVQATLFVDAFEREGQQEGSGVWRGSATVGALEALLARFIGSVRAEGALRTYEEANGVTLYMDQQADAELVQYAERVLAGAIGAASARVTMSTVVQGEALSLDAVMKILDETSQILGYSRRLEQKSGELERASAELRAANERLKGLDHLKDEFVSTVSHELRTPLTSIRAFSEILLNTPNMPTKQRAEFLQIVVKESERLTRLINQVLDVTRIESGQIEWASERMDLRQVLEEAIRATGQIFREKGVHLEPSLPDVAVQVDGDRDRIMQVIINLLSNAAKFCRVPGGLVEISLAGRRGEARIEVRDNGPGIPRDQTERVFERFHQVRSTDGAKPQGSGLGLAIARQIVERHGGRIWAEHRSDGATFVVVLPLVRA